MWEHQSLKTKIVKIKEPLMNPRRLLIMSALAALSSSSVFFLRKCSTHSTTPRPATCLKPPPRWSFLSEGPFKQSPQTIMTEKPAQASSKHILQLCKPKPIIKVSSFTITEQLYNNDRILNKTNFFGIKNSSES